MLGENMWRGKFPKLSRKHLEVLQALAAAGPEGLTKEEIAEVVKNRHTAIKIRNDLLALGLIRINPRGKKLKLKTVETYTLAVNSLETLYVWELLQFFERAFVGGDGGLVVGIDPSGAVIICENDLYNAEAYKQLYLFYCYRLPVELTRIRVMMSELWDGLVLTQFDKEEREALVNYRQKLKEICKLYFEIWLRHVLKKTYGVSGRNFDEVLFEVVRIPPTTEELKDALLKHYRGGPDRLDMLVKALSKNTDVSERVNEKIFKVMKTLYEKIIEYNIWQYDNIIVDIELLGRFLDDIIRDEEVAAEATEEEKARLRALYNDLTNPAMLRLYQQFLDKRAQQPKELIIIPSGGFRGYFAKYWHYAGALGDQEEKKKVLEIFKEANKMNLWPPFILYGMLPEPPFFKHVEEENEE